MSEQVIADLGRAIRGGESVYAVHYCCESFYEALDHPPAVSAIGVSSVPRARSLTFSRIDIDTEDQEQAERELLNRFFDWLRSIPDARLVHWNMNSSEFGFVALRNRYAYLGGTPPPVHSEDRTLDLDDLIASRHGRDYVGHPRLTRTLALNGVATRYTLSGPEQAQRFKDGAHADLARCANERAMTIAVVAELFVGGRLQTERSGPAVRFGGAMIDSVDVVTAIGERIRAVARELAHRHGGRPTLEMTDEHDYQDLLRAGLRIFFDDIRPEDPVPVLGGAGSRIDFVLPEYGIAVEVKAARESLTEGRLGEELIVDSQRYQARGGVRHLVCLAFDPEGLLRNPRGLERDLSGVRGELAVTVRIFT
jgi:hypothetical protein